MDEENINYSTNDAGLDNQPVGMEPMNTEPVVESMNTKANVEPVNDEIKTELIDVKDNNIEPASVEAEPADVTPVNTEPMDAKTEPELNNGEQEIKFDNSKEKKSSRVVLLSVITGMLVVILVAMFAILPNLEFTNKDTSKHSETTGGNDEPIEEKKEINLGELGIQGNGLEELDLAFLKLENNNEKNIVYSPLSIKYALAMLNEGTGGNSKEQIEKVLGNYVPKKYINSENLSLANAMFVNEAYQDGIKEEYSLNLQTKYGAELIRDSLTTPDNINVWVKSKTFGLVNNIVQETDPVQDVFYLVNALAIDMEWKQKIYEKANRVVFRYMKDAYTNYADFITQPRVDEDGKTNYDVVGAKINAIANKYDIINELGEDKIRETVKNAYTEWVQENQDVCTEEEIAESVPDLDNYVDTLSQYYGHLSSSTDFEFYDDSSVTVFAKDLKEYDGTTLQYVGIMPKDKSINEYINTASVADIDRAILNLKPIEMKSFKDKTITILSGRIPFFAFDYGLDFVNDLENIGITDIFDGNVADLSGIVDVEEKVYITQAAHRAKIDFNNDGIKAGAATAFAGGLGSAGGCQFEYEFEVPIERIELKFNNPYIFLVRDKNTGEAWFAGVVHDPQQKAE